MFRPTHAARAVPLAARAAEASVGTRVPLQLLQADTAPSVFRTPLNVGGALQPVKQTRKVLHKVAVQNVREGERAYVAWAGWVHTFRIDCVALGVKEVHTFVLDVPAKELKEAVLPRQGDTISVVSRDRRVASWRPLRADELAPVAKLDEVRAVVFRAVVNSALGSNLSVRERLEAYQWGLHFVLEQ